jgi:hypothetical protein
MSEDDTNADEMHTRERDRAETGDEESGEVDWAAVASDPDPKENLGYELSQWEEIPVEDDPDQVIFLPSNEEDIAEDAFIVSESDAICDLVSRR